MFILGSPQGLCGVHVVSGPLCVYFHYGGLLSLYSVQVYLCYTGLLFAMEKDRYTKKAILHIEIAYYNLL